MVEFMRRGAKTDETHETNAESLPNQYSAL